MLYILDGAKNVLLKFGAIRPTRNVTTSENVSKCFLSFNFLINDVIDDVINYVILLNPTNTRSRHKNTCTVPQYKDYDEIKLPDGNSPYID